jgi:hypothetical protein
MWQAPVVKFPPLRRSIPARVHFDLRGRSLSDCMWFAWLVAAPERIRGGKGRALMPRPVIKLDDLSSRITFRSEFRDVAYLARGAMRLPPHWRRQLILHLDALLQEYGLSLVEGLDEQSSASDASDPKS